MNQEIKKTVLILEKIISLKNEAVFGDFVFNFLKELSKFDSIKKNYIHKERFKIVATKGTPKLIFLSHLDTVSLFEKQKFGPQKDKFYGLGAKDMKGGIAALLLALKESKKVNNLGVIFYTGEETDQAGIRSLLKNWKYNSKLVVCPESRFEIVNGNRGLIILKAEIFGKKAHTARPKTGKNAPEEFWELFKFLKMKLGCYKSKIFGKTQLNLLSIKSLPEDNIEGVLPDYCVVTIEIRPASRKVNLSLLKKLMKKFCKKQKIKVKFKVLRDFPLVYVSPKKLNLLIQAIKKVGETEKFADIKLAGFNDARIITAKFGIPVVNFGPYGEGNHTPEEWVSVKSVQKTKEVYKNLIEIYS